MGTIKRYAIKSNLMSVQISYGEENFSFNLNTELQITEDRINQEIKQQPSAYAFLSMLHKKLVRISKDKEMEMEKEFSKIYLIHKSKIDPDTRRPYPKETANHEATKSKTYIEKVRVYNKVVEDVGIIETCVKAFEQRAFLIQTISANIRKER